MEQLNNLKNAFTRHFGSGIDNLQFFFAPGRLCLIGEHIDYNGGRVLPAAISAGIYAAFQPDGSRTLKLASTAQEQTFSLCLDKPIHPSDITRWSNYPAGVIKYLQAAGLPIPGGRLLFHSDLPMGAGLSSSAAIEVLTAYIFTVLHNREVNRNALATLCKQVENDFVGLKCGIMDQFAVAHGRKDHAMLLDCEQLTCEYVPVSMGGCSLVIFNTNKQRELTDSHFNQRVQECNEALMAISRHRNITNLAEATVEDVNRFVTAPVPKRRALHVVQENARVKEAAEALQLGRIREFGALLNKSHDSLRFQYEVTGPELDAIVDAARQQPECAGAKMSGAGFGGCAFAIIEQTDTGAFVARVLQLYKEKTGKDAASYQVEVDDGVRRIG